MNKKTNWQKTVKHIGGLTILLLLLTLLPSQSVYAATITVNSLADNLIDGDGNCTLREAIMNANSDSAISSDCAAGTGADTIDLATGTYTLALTGINEEGNLTGDLDITDPDGLTITGADARTTIIEAGTTSSNGIDRVFHISGGATAIIEQVTIQHGRFDLGGGILNQGNLTLNTVNMNNNSSTNGDGGAIRNLSTLTLNQSTINNNMAARHGGAIHNQNSGTLTINNSTISNNIATQNAGGLNVLNGTVTINNSTIAYNSANISGLGINQGGGITQGGGTVNIKNTIIANNIANSNPSDCDGTLISLDYNLIQEVPAPDCTISGTTTNNTTGDPMLGGLTNNGGSTDTHELQGGSPAIDTGGATCMVSEDQRGGVRPQDSGCDIGAYEVGALAAFLASFTATHGGAHVRVEWATVSESNNLGFNLYRNTSPEFSEAERLNATLIPAGAPGTGGGFTYEYDDDDVVSGTTYHYWLGDVDVAGHETIHQKTTLIDYAFIATSVRMTDFESRKPSNLSWLVMLTVLGMTIGAISMQRRK